jgi:ankyrin repeat protein
MFVSVQAMEPNYSIEELLMHAVIQNSEQHVRQVLNCKPSINQMDDDRRFPLHYAAAHGYEAIVEMLVAYDPKAVHLRDYHLKTPLHHAASSGHAKIAKILICYRADKNPKDQNGSTPIELAINGRTECSLNTPEWFEYNAVIDCIENDGPQILLLANESNLGWTEAIKMHSSNTMLSSSKTNTRSSTDPLDNDPQGNIFSPSTRLNLKMHSSGIPSSGTTPRSATQQSSNDLNNENLVSPKTTILSPGRLKHAPGSNLPLLYFAVQNK